MRIKTIAIIIITMLLTVVLTQNTNATTWKFLWATFSISKLLVLFVVALIAFILGILVGKPKRVKRLGGDTGEEGVRHDSPNTLSEEDKDYIS